DSALVTLHPLDPILLRNGSQFRSFLQFPASSDYILTVSRSLLFETLAPTLLTKKDTTTGIFFAFDSR
ncbi:hypothetical protein, partial [Bacillus thuringiensis]|uniref:hypothetical protein n=1 Tax=Bacillus thuringiensis TaxID=1428 RepID=UPI001C3F38F3